MAQINIILNAQDNISKAMKGIADAFNNIEKSQQRIGNNSGMKNLQSQIQDGIQKVQEFQKQINEMNSSLEKSGQSSKGLNSVKNDIDVVIKSLQTLQKEINNQGAGSGGLDSVRTRIREIGNDVTNLGPKISSATSSLGNNFSSLNNAFINGQSEVMKYGKVAQNSFMSAAQSSGQLKTAFLSVNSAFVNGQSTMNSYRNTFNGLTSTMNMFRGATANSITVMNALGNSTRTTSTGVQSLNNVLQHVGNGVRSSGVALGQFGAAMQINNSQMANYANQAAQISAQSVEMNGVFMRMGDSLVRVAGEFSQVALTTTPISTGLSEVATQFSGVDRAITTTSTGLANITSLAQNMATGFTGSIGGIVNSLSKFEVSVSAAMQLSQAFFGLMGDGYNSFYDVTVGLSVARESIGALTKGFMTAEGEADAFMHQMDIMSNNSIVSMDELAKAVINVKTSTGISNDAIRQYLPLIDEMGQRAKLLGRSGQDVIRLMDSAFDGLNGNFMQLSRSLGITKGKVMEMGWSGASDDVDGYAMAIQKLMARTGSLDSLMETTQGSIEKWRKAMRIAGREIGDFLKPLLKWAADTMIAFFNVNKIFAQVPLLIMGMVVTMTTAVPVARSFLSVIELFGTQAISVFTKLNTFFTWFSAGLGAGIKSVGGAITGMGTQMLEAVELAANGGRGVYSYMNGLFLLSQGANQAALSQAGLSTSLLAVNLSTQGSTVATKLLRTELYLLGGAVKIVLWQLIAITAIIAGLVYLAYEFGKAAGWWSDWQTMLQSIQEGLSRIWESFKENKYVLGFIQLLKDTWDSFVEAIASGFTPLKEFLDSISQSKDPVQDIINLFGALGDKLYEFGKKSGLIQFFKELLNVFVQFGYVIGYVLGLLSNLLVFIMSNDWARGILVAVVAFFSLAKIITVVTNLMLMLGGAVRATLKEFRRLVSGAVSGLKSIYGWIINVNKSQLMYYATVAKTTVIQTYKNIIATMKGAYAALIALKSGESVKNAKTIMYQKREELGWKKISLSIKNATKDVITYGNASSTAMKKSSVMQGYNRDTTQMGYGSEGTYGHNKIPKYTTGGIVGNQEPIPSNKDTERIGQISEQSQNNSKLFKKAITGILKAAAVMIVAILAMIPILLSLLAVMYTLKFVGDEFKRMKPSIESAIEGIGMIAPIIIAIAVPLTILGYVMRNAGSMMGKAITGILVASALIAWALLMVSGILLMLIPPMMALAEVGKTYRGLQKNIEAGIQAIITVGPLFILIGVVITVLGSILASLLSVAAIIAGGILLGAGLIILGLFAVAAVLWSMIPALTALADVGKVYIKLMPQIMAGIDALKTVGPLFILLGVAITILGAGIIALGPIGAYIVAGVAVGVALVIAGLTLLASVLRAMIPPLQALASVGVQFINTWPMVLMGISALEIIGVALRKLQYIVSMLYIAFIGVGGVLGTITSALFGDIPTKIKELANYIAELEEPLKELSKLGETLEIETLEEGLTKLAIAGRILSLLSTNVLPELAKLSKNNLNYLIDEITGQESIGETLERLTDYIYELKYFIQDFNKVTSDLPEPDYQGFDKLAVVLKIFTLLQAILPKLLSLSNSMNSASRSFKGMDFIGGGILSKLTDPTGALGFSSFFTGINNLILQLKDFINGFNESVKDLPDTDKFSENVTKLQKTLAIFPILQSMLNELTKTYKSIGEAGAGAESANGSGGFGWINNFLVDDIVTLEGSLSETGKFQSIITKIVDIVKRLNEMDIPDMRNSELPAKLESLSNTFSKIMEAVQKVLDGVIKFDKTQKSGGMEKDWLGQGSDIEANINLIIGIFEKIKTAVEKISNESIDMPDDFNSNSLKKIGEVFNTIMEGVQEALEAVVKFDKFQNDNKMTGDKIVSNMDLMLGLFDKIKENVEKITNKDIDIPNDFNVESLKNIANVFKTITDAVQEGLEAIGKFAKFQSDNDLFGDNIVKNFELMIGLFEKIVDSVKKIINSGLPKEVPTETFEGIKTIFGSITSSVNSALESANKMKDSIDKAGSADALTTNIDKIKTIFLDIIKIIKETSKEVTGISVDTELFSNINKIFKSITTSVNTAIETATTMKDSMEGSGMNLELLNLYLAEIKTIYQDIITTIKEVTSSVSGISVDTEVFSNINSAFTSIADAVTKAIETATKMRDSMTGSGMDIDLLKLYLAEIKTIYQDIITTIEDVMNSVSNISVDTEIFTTINTAFTSIADAVTKAIETATTMKTSLESSGMEVSDIGTYMTHIKTIFNTVKDMVVEINKGMSDVGDVDTEVYTTLATVMESVQKVVTKAIEAVTKMKETMDGGMLGGGMSIDDIKEKIKEMAQIIQTIQEEFAKIGGGKEGAISIDATIGDAVTKIADGIAKLKTELETGAEGLKTAAKSIGTKINEGMKEGLQNIDTEFRATIQKLSNEMDAEIKEIATSIENGTGTIGKAAKSLGETIAKEILAGMDRQSPGLAARETNSEMGDILGFIVKKTPEIVKAAHNVGSAMSTAMAPTADPTLQAIGSNIRGKTVINGLPDKTDPAIIGVPVDTTMAEESFGMLTGIIVGATDTINMSMFGVDTTFQNLSLSILDSQAGLENSTMVIGNSFMYLGNSVKQGLEQIIHSNKNSWDNVNLVTNQSLQKIQTSTLSVTKQMTTAWSGMGNQLKTVSGQIQAQSYAKFNSLHKSISSFYNQLASARFTGGLPAGPAPSLHAMMNAPIGNRSSNGGRIRGLTAGSPGSSKRSFTGFKGSRSSRKSGTAGPDPNKSLGMLANNKTIGNKVGNLLNRARHSSIAKEQLEQLMSSLNIPLDYMYTYPFGSLVSTNVNRQYNTGREWDAGDPRFMNIRIPVDWKAKEFEGGKNPSWGDFDKLMYTVLGAKGGWKYSFYYNSMKSNQQVWDSGICNCYDGAEMLLELASFFGKSGSLINGSWNGIPHTAARIDGKIYDMTQYQKRGVFRGSGGVSFGGGSHSRAMSGLGMGSKNNDMPQTISETVTITISPKFDFKVVNEPGSKEINEEELANKFFEKTKKYYNSPEFGEQVTRTVSNLDKRKERIRGRQ